MKRWLLAALLCCLPGLALAQGAIQQSGPIVPGHGAVWLRNGIVGDSGVALPGPAGPYLPLNGGALTGGLTGPSIPTLEAYNYGVRVNTGTTQDVAMYNAAVACTAIGGRLEFGPGVMTWTGVVSIPINQCIFVGSGSPQGVISGQNGTSFNITGTGSSPFIFGVGFGFEGINLFWPNQNGTSPIHYPPWATDGGPGTFAFHGYINNVTVVNAWDGIAQSTCATVGDCAGWGDIKLSNMTIFGGGDAFRFTQMVDGIQGSNIRVLPGPLLGWCDGTSDCLSQAGKLASTARTFHAANPTSGGGGTVNWNFVNVTVVGARYFVLVDSNETVAETTFLGLTLDAVGTDIDTSSGGAWYGFGVQFSGFTTGCTTPNVKWGQPNTGNAPCFNMGGAGELILTDWHSAGSQGDFIATSFTDIVVSASESLSIGSVLDGGDYYQIRINSSGSPRIRVYGSRFGGRASDAHVHGITTTGSGTPDPFVALGDTFEFLNDDFNVRFPQGAIVTGSKSQSTNAAGGLISLNQIGTNAIIYNSNIFDSPPLVTAPSCGTSPVLHQSTLNSGFVTPGSDATYQCTLHWPIVLAGFCSFQASNAYTLGIGPSGSPPSYQISSYVGNTPTALASVNLFWYCQGS